MSKIEMVVLVDDNGEELGVAPKATVHTSATPLHRAFSCHVFDTSGRVLITRRSPDKLTFPGLWTNSVCGHPGPDETDVDAIHRRSAAELSMQVEMVRPALPHFRYTAQYRGVVENEICPVYLALASEPAAISPDRAEVADLYWTTWDDFMESVRSQPDDFSPWSRTQAQLLTAAGEPQQYLLKDSQPSSGRR